MVSCRILTSEQDIEVLAPAWREIHERLGLSPFTDYDWAMAWWRLIGQPSGASLFVVACFEEGKLVGVIPFSIRKKGFVRILRLLGHEVYYYRNFLVERPDLMPIAWQTVFSAKGYDWANIKNIHEGTAEDSFIGQMAERIHASLVYHCEGLGLPREIFLQRFSANFNRKFRAVERKISANDELSVRLSQAYGSEEKRVIDFLTSRKKRWAEEKGKRGIFNEESPDLLYHELAHLASQAGTLLLCWMEKGSQIVGASLCFSQKGILYGHTLAFDPVASSYMPGLYLNREALLWASDNGFIEKNFMEGEEEYKGRFTKTGRRIHEYAFARTLVGRVFLYLYRRVRHYREWKSLRRQKAVT